MSRILRNPSTAELYQAFHGRMPGNKEVTPFYDPASLIALGRAVAVIYECKKENGGGDGRLNRFIHEFETPAGLFMDERGGRQLYILGPKIIVTDAGIEN